MKPPRRPPDLSKLMGKFDDAEWIFRALQCGEDEARSGSYAHWDKLRFHPVPEGLTHEQWWFGLKMRRRGQARPTPLLDRAGVPFRYNLVDPILELLHQADSSTHGAIQVSSPITNLETKKQYLIRSLSEEAITSSLLEGANTSRKVAKEMIRLGRPPKNLGEQMILNNYHAMEHILEIRDQPLTPGLVFEIHRMVTERTLDDASGAGRLRSPSEEIVVSDFEGQVLHEPPAAAELPARLEAMCAFANGEGGGGFIHPVVHSIILHFWLAYDHPFIDGNGRTARALFYWSMLHRGYWLFEFISISRIILKAPIKYAMAYLDTETDDNDLTYFLVYHVEVIRRAIADLHVYLERKTTELNRAIADLRGLSILNHRQRDLIQHALRHPGHVYTIDSHRGSHGVTLQTARTDLLNLVDRGLLSKRKSGRFWNFRSVPNLDAKLKE